MAEVDLSKAVEFVKGRLYYVALRSRPRDSTSSHFFCVDDELVYWNFFLDFGPLNLGQLYRFCQILSNKLYDKRYSGKRIFFYSSTHSHKRTNAAFLISAYAMLYLGRTPEEAYAPFENYYPPFPPFHDASPCICTYNLTILDCLRGIHRAKSVGFFDFDKFNIDEYEYFERVENGDLNWLAEGKVLAFAGPHEVRSSTPEGYHTLSPDDYIPYFKKKNVSLVVRLNKKYYDENRFKKVGIDHVDLYYLDGSCPTDAILNRFLSAVEKTKGAFAVHCKAGLGRTGTCIGAWMMKHYNFSAAEVIGWLRVCRPGSVIGPQQHYLKEIEPRMWAAGERARRKQAAERVQREVKQGTLHTKGSHHSNIDLEASDALQRLTLMDSAELSKQSAPSGTYLRPSARSSRLNGLAGSARSADPYSIYGSGGGGGGGDISPTSPASHTSQGDSLLAARDRSRRVGTPKSGSGLRSAASSVVSPSYLSRHSSPSSGTPPKTSGSRPVSRGLTASTRNGFKLNSFSSSYY